MSAMFCCSSIKPYRPRVLDHEAEFSAFMSWASLSTTSRVSTDDCSAVDSAPYTIQLVRQINYGPQESIRYFVPASNISLVVRRIGYSFIKVTLRVYSPLVLMSNSSSAASNMSEAFETPKKSMKPKVKRY